ncbi:DUF305 domain-containing protein [Streptomyces sp. NPDC058877]|uniref:DUF305 domain-containing protein n=1 Tax=unclassified Streptomyces TaxID=2593676 RepID=UPI00368FE653
MRAPIRPTTRRLALVGAVTGAAFLLAACGTDDDARRNDGGTSAASPDAAASPETAAGGGAAPGAFNDADVMFAQMMIPHHEQALEMARLAEGRASDPEVKELVAAIEQAQDPEIQKMKAWLKGWGAPGAAEHGSGHGMAGMMSAQDMERLAAAEGESFDRAFAELMTAHHDGAVAMAKDELRKGLNPTAKELADDVVRTQSAEIGRLRTVLDRL